MSEIRVMECETNKLQEELGRYYREGWRLVSLTKNNPIQWVAVLERREIKEMRKGAGSRKETQS